MKEPQEIKRDISYERMKTLYFISRQLSNFINDKESFPKIFASIERSFPLLTAVVVENWSDKANTFVWSAENFSHHEAEAKANAKEAFVFLSGQQAFNINPTEPDIHKDSGRIKKNYINLPLMIDGLPPMGILQIEGSEKLTEDDLFFVETLANLISVALDRYHKTKKEELIKDNIAKESLNSLYRSIDKVENLEIERELREEFVAILTHDLKTPLSVILGSAEFILLKSTHKEYVEISAQRIVKTVHRVEGMITNLLDANRIRGGQKLPLNKESVDLQGLIANTVSNLSNIHGNRFEVKCDEIIFAKLDPHAIERVIENLCNNAIKYGSPHTKIEIAATKTAKNISLSVFNQGEAISVKDQETLFEQFRRTEKANQSHIQGWGIGLTLVRGVAEAHDGTVSVESRPDFGTRFTVTFPLILT